jgi:hypothetical protein
VALQQCRRRTGDAFGIPETAHELCDGTIGDTHQNRRQQRRSLGGKRCDEDARSATRISQQTGSAPDAYVIFFRVQITIAGHDDGTAARDTLRS